MCHFLTACIVLGLGRPGGLLALLARIFGTDGLWHS